MNTKQVAIGAGVVILTNVISAGIGAVAGAALEAASFGAVLYDASLGDINAAATINEAYKIGEAIRTGKKL